MAKTVKATKLSKHSNVASRVEDDEKSLSHKNSPGAKKNKVNEEIKLDKGIHDEMDVASDNSDDSNSSSESSDLSDQEEASLKEDESDSQSEASSVDDSEEEITTLARQKNKSKKGEGAESFGTAFNAIVGSHIKAHQRKDPILARNKSTLKKLESEKLDAKAKRLLVSEKKQLQDKHRVKNLLPSAEEPEKVRDLLDREKKMKKTAQKGVVRLFNAILSTQIQTSSEMENNKVLGESKKETLLNDISKEKFLDLVQAAGH
ncbi:Piso0_005842 [Millerozyma farinosa CBS 7064]|uniref:Piso0_005842 protein n=1 Tax=Pichia sorbitophila (strain ATCC MYA-4447 / BCRC 22081 / CBS 7064 / NBRC 10061 / NRRL Y-12695) TaxID=559304 RepID=G8Y325_PICSO|nr:Piso0_005842 [Millerozyma farinosa CBS 7064]